MENKLEMQEKRKMREDIKFFGKASEAKKELHRQELAAVFHGKKPPFISLEDWEKAQVESKEKTPQEIAAIRIANAMTNETRVRYGLEAFDFPEKNIPLLADNVYKKCAGGIDDPEFEVATSDSEHQRIYIREKIARLYPLHAAETILHEIAHAKSALSFEILEESILQDDEQKEAIVKREGLTTYGSSKKVRFGKDATHFLGLDEAIIENYMIRRVQNILEEPQFSEEQAWLSSGDAQKIKENVSQREGVALEQIAWVSKEGKWQPYSYIPQRSVLRYCAEEIVKQFPEFFQSAEAVIDRFEEGVFVSRRLLSLGRFIEKIFGKGSFRKLAEMNDEKEGRGGNAGEILAWLQNHRTNNRS